MPLTLTEKLDSRKWNTGDKSSNRVRLTDIELFFAPTGRGRVAGGVSPRNPAPLSIQPRRGVGKTCPILHRPVGALPLGGSLTGGSLVLRTRVTPGYPPTALRA